MRKTLFIALLSLTLLPLSGCSTLSSVKQWWSEDETLPEDIDQRPQTPRIEVEVEGLSDELADNVRATLALAREACDAPRWRAEREFAGSDEDVRLALRAFGHYEPSIDKSFEEGEDCWLARYDIDAGPRVAFGEIDVRIEGEGETDKRFGEFLANLPVQAGEPLNHGRYEGLKSRIESIAAERGFFQGRFTTSVLRVDVEAGTADVTLRFQSGPRFVLGTVDVRQQAFDDGLIERLTIIEPGQPYDSARLSLQNRTFADSGYFGLVDVSPRIGVAKKRADEGTAQKAADAGPPAVPVEVDLEARAKHSYTAGVGYATDSGPRIRLGYENRRLNRLGHRWDAKTSLSPKDSEVQLDYRIPLADPRTEWLNFQLGYSIKNTKTSESQTARLGVSRTGSRFGWAETQSLNITHDSFTVGGVDGTTLLVVPGVSWQKTEADDPLRPTRGWSAYLGLNGTHEALLSDTTFIQARTRLGAVYGLPWGDRILGRAEFGATAVTDFDVLPPDYRFFAGGDNSIRGYGFEELGPKDGQGLVIGGRYLAVGSLEYEHALNEQWSVAGFVDAGNAYDDFDDGIKVGVGGGVRWQSPVGPLRLDLGFPLDDESEDTFRIHVRFGPDL